VNCCLLFSLCHSKILDILHCYAIVNYIQERFSSNNLKIPMNRKKKIYLQYAVIFALIIVLGIINFIIKTPYIWRSSIPAYEYKTISPEEFREMMNSNSDLIIVDTRIKEDFQKGYIKGAINLPYTNFKNMEKSLKENRDKEIILYSEDGDRSKKICDFLSNLGFSNIMNLNTGINGWVESGGEVVQ